MDDIRSGDVCRVKRSGELCIVGGLENVAPREWYLLFEGGNPRTKRSVLLTATWPEDGLKRGCDRIGNVFDWANLEAKIRVLIREWRKDHAWREEEEYHQQTARILCADELEATL